MARNDPQINIRIPADLKARLEEAAMREGKSVTAVIVQRLEDSFPLLEGQLLDRRLEEISRIAFENSRISQVIAVIQRDLTTLMSQLKVKNPDDHPLTKAMQKDLETAIARAEAFDEMHLRYTGEARDLQKRIKELMGTPPAGSMHVVGKKKAS